MSPRSMEGNGLLLRRPPFTLLRAAILFQMAIPPMDPNIAKPLPAFGFLTVVEDPLHGFFGGYLVVSALGRPLEFHCSAPIQPTVAQRILYGATLRSYVSGELIGQTLLTKSQLPVQAVLTDWPEVLSLAGARKENIVCLAPAQHDAAAAESPADQDVPELRTGHYRLFGTSACNWRADTLEQALAPLAHSIDLAEPFQRIRDAIREAQRVTEVETDDDHSATTAA